MLGVLAIGDVFAKFVYLGLNIRLRRFIGRCGSRNGLFDFYLFTLLAGALVSLTGRKGSEGKGKEKKKKFGLMVKCTPERGHNALFFIPLEVIIML